MAELKACQAPELAAAILSGLEQWSFAVGILTGFAGVPAFHDAIIEHDKEVLDKLMMYESKYFGWKRG